MSPAIPAVMSPAIPATTGSVSGSLYVDVEIKGIPDALDPLLEGTIFSSSSMGEPDSTGLANQLINWLSSGTLDGSQIIITTSFGYKDLEIDIAGVTTDLGSIAIPVGTLPAIPPITGSITTSANWPSFGEDESVKNTTSEGVSYELFPQVNELELTDFTVNISESILETYIVYDLEQLDNYWNEYVCTIFDAAGAGSYCLTSPAEFLIQDIEDIFNEATDGALALELGGNINKNITSTISQFLPYTQAIAAATWNKEYYPILPSFNYTNAIMTEGLFSSVNASYSNFTNADLSNSNFSNAILTGANFTGANLTNANFTGATGAPEDESLNSTEINNSNGSTQAFLSLSKARNVQGSNSNLNRSHSENQIETDFTHALLFGADLRGSNLNLSGAFINRDAKTDRNFDANKEGLQIIDHNIFILENDLLEYRKYAKRPKNIFKSISKNIDPKTLQPSAKNGLFTQIITGEAVVDPKKFNAEGYFDMLPDKMRGKISQSSKIDRSTIIARKYIKWSTKNLNINGNEKNNIISGLNGNDLLNGRNGSDELTGGHGHDKLNGGNGIDFLIGGSGKDTFIISKGNDRIKDFNLNEFDIINLENANIVKFEQDGSNTVINSDLGSTTIVGLDFLNLQSSYRQSIGSDGSMYAPIISSVPISFA
jgi:Ca2+-binding RTX toxin-like protein